MKLPSSSKKIANSAESAASPLQPTFMSARPFVWLLGLILLMGCGDSYDPLPIAVVPSVTPIIILGTIPPDLTQTATPTTVAQPTVTDVQPPTPLPPVDEPCGQLLPLLLPTEETPDQWGVPPLSAELIPPDVLPALEQFFAQPDDVSLVVYRVGYEGVGFYHNPQQPMPLASISKLIELLAYDEAVSTGELDPQQAVDSAELAQFYLPRSDLGAHTGALRALDEDNLVLDDIAWMMMRHSANSASDYLHDLLGQAELEQFVIDLGLKHSAICPFIGRFLAMSNPDRTEPDRAAIEKLVADPDLYGDEVMRLTDRYLTDETFRDATARYWGRRNQPSVATQAYFVRELETRGTARDYADLMAQISTNQLGTDLTRQQLEWPYDRFEINQERYSMVGYKNGTFPGVLNSLYYAWPTWSDQPMVVALFYQNIPNPTYQRWRRSFPHDAFAHWLMTNPNALHIMHVLRDSAAELGAEP